MTKSELLAQAEGLEWASRLWWSTIGAPPAKMLGRALELRAQAEKAAEAPDDFEFNPDAAAKMADRAPTGAADPKPVAWLVTDAEGGIVTVVHSIADKEFYERCGGVTQPFYTRPDPRIAEYRELLREVIPGLKYYGQGSDTYSLLERIRAALKEGV